MTARETTDLGERGDFALIDAIDQLAAQVGRAREAIGRVIFGQDRVIDETLITLLSGGHLLLIGVPGLGKTKLVETLGTGIRPGGAPGAVHAGPDAGRYPRIGGAGGDGDAAGGISASSRVRCSASC